MNDQQLLAPEAIHDSVRDWYAQRALEVEQIEPNNNNTDCCGPNLAGTGFGAAEYQTDLSQLPASVTNLSLGCGDPIIMANLGEGQTVLDLGSGGGIDCFLAAKQVGPTGQVIGVDMTPEMLVKAEANKAALGVTQVSFRQGMIEALPVESETIDVVISNCVVNLSPDKPAVLRETWRVLKPGGRVAISDMVTVGAFTAVQKSDMAAWSGCIAGAERVGFYVAELERLGFEAVQVVDKNNEALDLLALDAGAVQASLISARITAVKPPTA